MRLVSSVASIHLDFFNLTYVYLIVQWQDSDIDELVIVLGYFIFLSILTVVKYREDPSVMHCRTHRFPLVYERRSLKSAPTSPSQPRFRNQSAPVIAAPRPQRIAQLREAVLSRRSSHSLEYEVEHFSGGPTLPTAQPTSPDDFAPQFGRATSLDVQSSDPHATSSDGHTFAIHIPQPMVALPPLQPVRSPSQSAPRPTYTPSPFYHSSVETAIRESSPRIPPPAQLNSGPVRLLPPSPPSPPPLGDWPRMDATSRPRMKRKPLPQPLPATQPQAQAVLPRSRQPLPNPAAPALARGPSHPPRALPRQPPGPPQPDQYSLDASALTAALQPLAEQNTSAWRSTKPSGPRRQSVDDGRPPALDLANISAFRSSGLGNR